MHEVKYPTFLTKSHSETAVSDNFGQESEDRRSPLTKLHTQADQFLRLRRINAQRQYGHVGRITYQCKTPTPPDYYLVTRKIGSNLPSHANVQDDIRLLIKW